MVALVNDLRYCQKTIALVEMVGTVTVEIIIRNVIRGDNFTSRVPCRNTSTDVAVINVSARCEFPFFSEPTA